MATRQPWWQIVRTARQGFVMGTFWIILGVVGLLVAHTTGLLAVSAIWLAIGVGYLAAAVAQCRRKRSNSGPDS